VSECDWHYEDRQEENYDTRKRMLDVHKAARAVFVSIRKDVVL